MKTLFLDLASHDSLIACTTAESVIVSCEVHERIGDHELIPIVEKLLSDAGWSYEDLERVACTIGPGGFTSLRITVTYVNVLADQLGIPSVGIHLSELYRARTDLPNVYWMHSTKKDQLFIHGGEWGEPTLITTDEIQNIKYKIQNWCGELIDEHQAIIHTEPVTLKPVLDLLPAFLQTQHFEKKVLTPWYGRGW